MTEAEWLTCEDAKLLLRFLLDKAGDRKMRLCVCAIVRREPESLLDELRKRGVEIAERVADGLATNEEREAIIEELQLRKENEVMQREFDRALLLRYVQDCLDRNQGEFVLHRSEHRVFSLEHAAVVRCISGNPFRPIAFSPDWRTDTAVMLARQMYDAREFSAMPILADALQDAGCDNDDILSHCGNPGEHVRGCWVVDLVLGKE